MEIEINNTTRQEVDQDLVRRVAKGFQEEFGQSRKSVSIAFVGDRAIRRLNKDYRKLDKVTDVLAFPEDDKAQLPQDRGYLGEIIIDLAQISRQAKKYKKSEQEELVFILVHGLLHLIGYDDKEELDRQRMNELAEKFIKSKGFK